MKPRFQVITQGLRRERFRDLPMKVLTELIRMSLIYARDISLAICLQAFAGLREGEVMSIRQQTSMLGPSLRIVRHGAELKKVSIDLLQDYTLRRDGVPTGTIKRHRTAMVFPAFLGVFDDVYESHLEYLHTRDFDRELAPMFIDRSGSAMTDKTYRRRVQKLVEDHLRPALMSSGDHELRTYGRLLQNHSFVPHAFRHSMSVALALLGASASQLQTYRGDASPEMAQYYLDNKDDLGKAYEKAQSVLIQSLLTAVQKGKGEKE